MTNITILDIGSRGASPDSWSYFFEHGATIDCHTFDADPAADIRQTSGINYKVHNYALWSEATKTLEFYLTENASQSSCFKPNLNFSCFEDQHHATRLIYEKKLLEKAFKLDDAWNFKEKIDLFTCDTQGSEYHISFGSKELLLSLAPVVALETWADDVYEGVPLDFDIRRFYNAIGYKLFASEPAAAWKYKVQRDLPMSRQRLIGENLLYFPSPSIIACVCDHDLLSKLYVMCYYGFYDYAFYLASLRKMHDVANHIENIYKSDINRRRTSWPLIT